MIQLLWLKVPSGRGEFSGWHVVRQRDTGIHFELESSDGLGGNDSLGVTYETDLWSLYVCAYICTHTCAHTHIHPSNNKRMHCISGSLSSATLCTSGLCISDHLAKTGKNMHSVSCTLRHSESRFTI